MRIESVREAGTEAIQRIRCSDWRAPGARGALLPNLAGWENGRIGDWEVREMGGMGERWQIMGIGGAAESQTVL